MPQITNVNREDFLRKKNYMFEKIREIKNSLSEMSSTIHYRKMPQNIDRDLLDKSNTKKHLESILMEVFISLDFYHR